MAVLVGSEVAVVILLNYVRDVIGTWYVELTFLWSVF